jgi:hypothetical protein
MVYDERINNQADMDAAGIEGMYQGEAVLGIDESEGTVSFNADGTITSASILEGITVEGEALGVKSQEQVEAILLGLGASSDTIESLWKMTESLDTGKHSVSGLVFAMSRIGLVLGVANIFYSVGEISHKYVMTGQVSAGELVGLGLDIATTALGPESGLIYSVLSASGVKGWALNGLDRKLDQWSSSRALEGMQIRGSNYILHK